MFRFFFTQQQWVYGLVISQESYKSWNASLVFAVIGCILAIAAVAYALGSVNAAIIVTRLVYGEDIRTKGSGNAGMTNVMRSYGWLPALITLIGDMLKCMLSMLLGTALWGLNGAYVAGFFCIIGHVVPAFYKFKGGKGVAATFMFILYIDVLAFVIIGLIFILLVWATKYLSLGSVITAMVMPLMLNKFDVYGNLQFIRLVIALLIGAMIVYKHRANIKRIMEKTESRFSFRKTVRKADIEAQVREENATPELTEDDIKRKEINRKKSAKKKK